MLGPLTLPALAAVLAFAGPDVQSTRAPALSTPGLQRVDVEASYCGVPTARPLARVLEYPDGRVFTIARSLPSQWPDCEEPSLLHADALNALEAAGIDVHGADARLRWVPRDGEWRLVWRVSVPPRLEIPSHPVYELDDATGVVRLAYERVRTADVRAYAENPTRTPEAEIAELIEIDDMPPNLEGPYFAAANCLEPNSGEGLCYRERTATPDLDGNFLYDAPDLDGPEEPEDLFAEASGYYHLDKFFAWLQGLGFEGTACHEQGRRVEIVVNRRTYDNGNWEPTDNAYYIGSCDASTIMMGQGERDFAYDGDIVDHELGHAVVHTLAGEDFGLERRRDDALGFDAWAIEEGVADFLAAAFMKDPLIAEYAFPSGGRPLDGDYTCPEDLSGEVHADGQIIGAALWEAFEAIDEPLVPVVLDALALLPEDGSFEDYSAALLAVAEGSLSEDERNTLESALETRGLLDCSRVVDFEDFGTGGVHEDLGRERLLFVRSPRQGNVYAPAPPPPLQWRVQMPDDADTATLRFAFHSDLDYPQGLGLGLKADEPIEYDYAIEGIDINVEADFDTFLPGADDGEIALETTPGSTVYLAMLHPGTGDPGTDRNAMLYDFSLEFSCSQDECVPDEGTGGDDTEGGESGGTGDEESGASGDESGCSCRASNPSPDATWAFAGLVLLAWRRRAIR